MSIVIGEGTYGCVHKPSLKCIPGTKINYDNQVSKILKKSSAKEELREYKKVTKADKKDEFYLGKPITCELDKTNADNLEAIAKCKIGKQALNNLANYDLIVMGDGGDNLETYSRKIRSWTISEMSTENCEKFLLEILRLFAGLKRFEENDLIHYDLKPQNIVFNEKTKRLNFIDFGMMQSRKKTIKNCNASKHGWAFFHWSYPWELEVLNKSTFEYVKRNWTHRFNVINNELSAQAGSYYNHIKDFCVFSLNRNNDVEYRASFQDCVRNYQDTLKDDMGGLGYNEFLKKSVGTIDVYGLGIALNYWFHSAKKHLDVRHANYLSYFFSTLISSRLMVRPTILEALESYENFIIISQLLDKYGKEIKDHIVVDMDIAPSTAVPRPSAAEPKISILRIEKGYRPDPDVVNATPKPCPDGKELNPKTGRCIKIKTKKAVDCPEGKTRNPKTGRCVKNKTQRVRDCPEDKEINPNTGRCIKKCRSGYLRDDNFKCVKNGK
jgi:serine/threonine protein kinase